MTIEHTEGVICPNCTEFIDEPGEAVYECSRCGQTRVDDGEDRMRCTDCRVFMAKAADQSCPSCEGPVEDMTDTVERWVVDGQAFETEAEAEAWIADAPNREAATTARKAAHVEWMAAYEAERKANAARVNGELRRILPRLAGTRRTAEHAEWLLGADHAVISVEVDMHDIAVIAGRTDLLDTINAGVDYSRPYEDRYADAVRVNAELRGTIGDMTGTETLGWAFNSMWGDSLAGGLSLPTADLVWLADRTGDTE